jgi:hypothetical protein
MPGPAPCKPHFRSSDSSIGRAPPDLGCVARFLEEQGTAAGSDETPSPAGGQKRGGKETLSLELMVPSLASRPETGRHAFRDERNTALSGLPIQPVKCAAPDEAFGDAGFTESFAALKISPNSGLHPSDTRSHGSRRSSSPFSDRPFPTSTGTDYSPRDRADQGRSAAHGDWPRSAGIP